MSNSTTIRRAKHDKEHPYVMISKNIFRDPDLSLKAKGLLGYLLSLPDNWVTHLIQVANAVSIGKDSAQSLFKELIDAGYCGKTIVREKGRFEKINYEFSEEKIFKKTLPQPEKPATVKPATENPPLISNDGLLSNENIILAEESDEKSDDHLSFPKIPARQHNLYNRDQKKSLHSKSSHKIFPEDSEAFKLAKYLESSIKSHIPDLSKKNLQAWAKHFDLMLRLDKRDISEIKSVIDWLPTDSFNHDKVLCSEKLRARYEELRSQSKKTNIGKVSIERNQYHAEQVKEAFRAENYIIEVLSSYIEFVPKRGNCIPDVVLYTSKNFKDEVNELIKKRKFEPVKRKQ